MSKLSVLLESKSTLFSIVTVGIFLILAIPVIFPHFFHGQHIFHIIMHVTGLILAVFVTIVAFVAYNRFKTKRLWLTSAGFSCFIVAEGFNLTETTWPARFDIGGVPLLEIGHIFILATLSLLALGVFRND